MRPITPDDQPSAIPLRDPGWLWGAPLYKVTLPWEWTWRGILILARPGYRFDGASVPRPFWAALGYTPDGLHRAAALAHDIGCDRQGCLITGAAVGLPDYPAVLLGDPTVTITSATLAAQLPSRDIHQLFRDFLDATEGIRPAKAAAMHLAVRTFGPRWP